MIYQKEDFLVHNFLSFAPESVITVKIDLFGAGEFMTPRYLSRNEIRKQNVPVETQLPQPVKLSSHI